MDRDVAREINSLMIGISGQLDDSIRLVMERSGPEEFRRYRQAAGKMMGILFVEILTPIYEEHPDLTPEELRKPQ